MQSEILLEKQTNESHKRIHTHTHTPSLSLAPPDTKLVCKVNKQDTIGYF